MPHIVNLVLLVLGIILIGVGIWDAKHSSGSPTALVVGICVLVVAWFSDNKRSKAAEANRLAESTKRIAALTNAPWPVGQSLVIKNGAGLFVGLTIAMLMLLAMIYAELNNIANTKYHVILMVSALLPLLIVSLGMTGAELFKPTLTLHAHGIDTALHGQIPWSEITGIDLEKHNNRGHISHYLNFRVEQYRRVVKDPHWTVRMLAIVGAGAIRRGYIAIRIKNKREQPETIYAVARFLWKQATNSDYVWSRHFSSSANTAMRNVGLALADHADQERLKQRVQSEPQKVMNEFKQIEKDLSIIREEGRKKSRQMLSISAILVVLLLITIFWPYLKRL